MAGMTRIMRVPAVPALTTMSRMAPMAVVVMVMMAVTTMMITVIMPMLMLMLTIIVMLLVILHFVLHEVPEQSTTNRTQQTMFLLMTEVIARDAASERTPEPTVHTPLSVGICIGALFTTVLCIFWLGYIDSGRVGTCGGCVPWLVGWMVVVVSCVPGDSVLRRLVSCRNHRPKVV